MKHKEHCNCGHEHHEDEDCTCHENCTHEHNKTPYKVGAPCLLEPETICNGCKACLMCDLDPDKICDNCGLCLDSYNTDEKGFVSIKVDKVITDAEDETSLEDLLKQYGLDGEDE